MIDLEETDTEPVVGLEAFEQPTEVGLASKGAKERLGGAQGFAVDDFGDVFGRAVETARPNNPDLACIHQDQVEIRRGLVPTHGQETGGFSGRSMHWDEGWLV